jgi:hypothetical protein
MVRSTTNYEGDDVESRGGDGPDVGDDVDGAIDVREMLPYAKKELMVSMAVISLRRLQPISPFGGGRRVPPLPLPQKIIEKLGLHFSIVAESTMRRRRRGDHQGPDGPGWHGLPGGPHHLCLLEPRGSSCVLQPLEVLLM